MYVDVNASDLFADYFPCSRPGFFSGLRDVDLSSWARRPSAGHFFKQPTFANGLPLALCSPGYFRAPAQRSFYSRTRYRFRRACNGLERMTKISISSRNDPLIKQIRSLHFRAERDRRGCYYVEGLRFVAQALRNNAQIEALVVCPALLRHPFAHGLVRQHELSGGRVLEVVPAVLHSISQVADPQGIGAVVRQKWLPLERVKLSGKLCWLAHDVVQSPGNLGAIVRTSDAVGGAGFILLGDGIDPYDPATVRASMGAMFTQRFVRTSVSELIP